MDRFAVISTKVRKDHNGVTRFSIENYQTPKSNHTLGEQNLDATKQKKEGAAKAPSPVKG